MEPTVVNTVSNFKVSADTNKEASAERLNSAFLQALIMVKVMMNEMKYRSMFQK
jgi:hypothetical protein